MTADRQRKASTSTATKTPAKKVPAKKVPAKKVPANKVPAKRTAATKASAAEAPNDRPRHEESAPEESTAPRKRPSRPRASAPRAESAPRASAVEVARRGAEQLSELTGRQVEGVTGVERDDDGWRISLEVLEVRRIPETTDVLAIYELDCNDKGELMSYRRVRRYIRGTPGED